MRYLYHISDAKNFDSIMEHGVRPNELGQTFFLDDLYYQYNVARDIGVTGEFDVWLVELDEEVQLEPDEVAELYRFNAWIGLVGTIELVDHFCRLRWRPDEVISLIQKNGETCIGRCADDEDPVAQQFLQNTMAILD